MGPRRLIVRLHLCLGMSVGFVVAVVSVTGGAIVFKPELVSYFDSELYAATPGDVGHQAVLDLIAERYPQQRVAILWWPGLYRPVYAAGVERESGDWLTIYVDPGTGRIAGTSDDHHWLTAVLEVAETIHVNLLAGEIGRTIVSWSVVIFIAVLLSGVALWWPGIRRFAHGFRVRRGKNTFLFSFDLHRVTGAVAFPFLFVMGGTGLVMAFPRAAESVVHGLFLSQPESDSYRGSTPRSVVPGSLPLERPTTEEMLQKGMTTVPGADIFYITFPEEPDEAVQVRLQKGIYPAPFGETYRVYLDQYSGEVLSVIDPAGASTPDRLLTHWNYPLHVGSIGKAPLRIVYCFVTLAPPVLMGTGVVIWWRKRQKRSNGKASRRALVRC